jgi:hypothetical protein
VADETVDVIDRKSITGEELRCGILELRGHKIRNVAGKDRSEAIIGDLPAHHVEAAGPGIFTSGDDGCALSFGRQQRSRGAIAEQSRRDDIAPEGQRAQFHGEEKYRFARGDGGLAGRAGKAEDPTRATEPKDRQPPHRAAQPHPFDQQRIEARRGDPRGRNDDNAVDIVLVAAGEIKHSTGCRLEKIERGAEIDAVALGPAMLTVVPFDRHAGVSRLNSSVQEYRQQAVELR